MNKPTAEIWTQRLEWGETLAGEGTDRYTFKIRANQDGMITNAVSCIRSVMRCEQIDEGLIQDEAQVIEAKQAIEFLKSLLPNECEHCKH